MAGDGSAGSPTLNSRLHDCPAFAKAMAGEDDCMTARLHNHPRFTKTNTSFMCLNFNFQ
jgi:hypothetical protein